MHSQVMAAFSLFKLHQECHQSLEEFRDQFTAMRQVCEHLCLKIGQSEQVAKAIYVVAEESLAIIFSCTWPTITDMEKNIEELGNAVLRKTHSQTM